MDRMDPLFLGMWRTKHSLKKIHAETIGAENTALSEYTDFLNTKRCLNKNILRRDGSGTRENITVVGQEIISKYMQKGYRS